MSVIYGEGAQGRFQVVIKETVPVLGNSVRNYRFLERKCLGRVEVVSHDPGERDVMPRRYQVGEAIYRFSAAIEPPGLHRFRMTADLLDL